MMARDHGKLKTLLEEQETFPLDFTLKFIGRNSARFTAAVAVFESEHPGLRLESRRESSAGKHLALTYRMLARNADEIVAIMRRIALIEDVQVIL
ncbi:MAG: DUF493 domain-containing protein [Oligoflexia bacterium]|nr:DUF493 domain-containing protein [Oligoflexia bacterium]